MNTPTPMPGTALPWRATDDFTCAMIGTAEADICEMQDWPLEFVPEQHANAAYIVWACNNAPALLSALEKARETLVRIAGRDFDCMPHQHGMAAAGHAQTALHDVEAALATAGGRNG